MQWMAILCAFSLLASSRSTVYVDDDDDTQENVEVWYGPGFYYGFWFDNEYEYRDWHDHHHGGGHHDGGHHDGGHHDGGHHHDGGGHRGGGSHGK